MLAHILLSLVLTMSSATDGMAAGDVALSDTIRTASIISEAKLPNAAEMLPAMTATILSGDLRQRAIDSPKALSAAVPNLLIPDYGSAMTSSVYMRGFGSRMDNPVIGLYVDDIPVLDKNAYDFDFLDVRRADFLGGPQGTLYGRNAMTGLLSISTLSPGDASGIGASLSYGTAGELRAKASWYGDRTSVAMGFSRGDGYYVNTFDGDKIDPHNSLNGRIRSLVADGVENILSFNLLDQGGYPYSQVIDGERMAIACNRYCGYKRITVTDGLKAKLETGKSLIHSMTSLQLLFDKMDMDQDFTADDIFSLRQSQHQYAITQELIVRPKSHPGWWNRQTGAFLLLRHNRLSAPVTFFRDGMESLILDNANAYIPAQFGRLDFAQNEFVISSDFDITTYNAAAFHESYFKFGRWSLTAGLRLDYEGGRMKYDCGSLVDYCLVGLMEDYRALNTSYADVEHNGSFEVIPKLSAVYDIPMPESVTLMAFGTFSKGYKAGGFNTQLFSDILRNRMMTGLMDDIGVHIDGQEYMDAGGTTYKPEESYNLEAGMKMGLDGGGHSLRLAASAYYIGCRNQQLTAFPPGQSQGRYMRNAGRSHSSGVEVTASYSCKGLSLSSSFGSANARYDRYDDGNDDYKGNHIPYAPQRTVQGRAAYTFDIGLGWLREATLGLTYTGVGPIWWDDANEYRQDYYGLLDADFSMTFDGFELFGNISDIMDEDYDVFWFKSVGNTFLQKGKPRRMRIGIRINI